MLLVWDGEDEGAVFAYQRLPIILIVLELKAFLVFFLLEEIASGPDGNLANEMVCSFKAFGLFEDEDDGFTPLKLLLQQLQVVNPRNLVLEMFGDLFLFEGSLFDPAYSEFGSVEVFNHINEIVTFYKCRRYNNMYQLRVCVR